MFAQLMQKKRGKGRKKREIFGDNDAKEGRKVAKKQFFGAGPMTFPFFLVNATLATKTMMLQQHCNYDL